ncbi:MAG: OmpH family outer membrane protein [Litoreibacter sp.]|nr:OmpH family outer membrane protein [Litoreibacter sp.]
MLRGAFTAGICAGLFALLPVAGYTQDVAATPVLTLNQDRLYASSLFGQRVLKGIEEESLKLAAENRRIEIDLVEEERRLTDERATMDAAEFRALALDFDERVNDIRRAQDGKRDALQRKADAERARFFELAFPILLELVEETGALAILNNSAVIFSVRQIDITDRAIDRINAVLGAAPPDPETGPNPTPRPEDDGAEPAASE